jgi:hypothetical protein
LANRGAQESRAKRSHDYAGRPGSAAGADRRLPEWRTVGDDACAALSNRVLNEATIMPVVRDLLMEADERLPEQRTVGDERCPARRNLVRTEATIMPMVRGLAVDANGRLLELLTGGGDRCTARANLVRTEATIIPMVRGLAVGANARLTIPLSKRFDPYLAKSSPGSIRSVPHKPILHPIKPWLPGYWSLASDFGKRQTGCWRLSVGRTCRVDPGSGNAACHVLSL